jgi:hypothetical protein
MGQKIRREEGLSDRSQGKYRALISQKVNGNVCDSFGNGISWRVLCKGLKSKLSAWKLRDCQGIKINCGQEITGLLNFKRQIIVV